MFRVKSLSARVGTSAAASWRNADTTPRMRGGSEEGSYSRLIDFLYHSTLGLRVIKKKKKDTTAFFFTNTKHTIHTVEHDPFTQSQFAPRS